MIMKIVSALILILAMTSIVSAEITENWTHGVPNTVPEGAVMLTFEGSTGNLNPLPTYLDGAITFEPSGISECWAFANIGGRGMHVYPRDFYHNEDGSEVDYIWIVNGMSGAVPMYNDALGQPWPSNRGIIRFRDGVSYVSALVSTGGRIEMRAYDLKGNYLGTSGRAYSNIARVSTGGPSTFTQMTYSETRPIIGHVEMVGYVNNWIMDDLVISDIELPVDYKYVSELAKEIFGMKYLEHGLGFDYEDLTYMESHQFPFTTEYYNPTTRQFEFGTGISNEGLIVWAYNHDEHIQTGKGLVKWADAANMKKHDFTIPVNSDNTQPGDVYFLDTDFDGKADSMGMVIEPTTPGFDLITAKEDLGVVSVNSHTTESSPEFIGYYRLPKKMHGGHNPIPKQR